MHNQELEAEICALEAEILEKKKRLAQLKKSAETKITNYEFLLKEGKKVTLKDLFGTKDELIIVHNMGQSCSYCTLWADGFNGIYHHLVKQVPFVVTSPDSPEAQEDFAASRGWKFPLISTMGSSFKEDLGFEKDGYYYPGVSTFRKDEEGNIYHHAKTGLGPYDDYCALWHLFDLLPSGAKGFQPTKDIDTNSPVKIANNIAFQVTNYEKAVTFYKEVLGMTVRNTHDNETHFSLGGTNFYVEDSKDGNTFFDLACEDIEHMKDKLLREGCKITKEYSHNSLMIADPYGFKFHLFEVKN
jgi:predicted dithiol-disulfide oxidoreductase (DUF899 family)/predicted enzyme related to lactoylglutathione lyase